MHRSTARAAPSSTHAPRSRRSTRRIKPCAFLRDLRWRRPPTFCLLVALVGPCWLLNIWRIGGFVAHQTSELSSSLIEEEALPLHPEKSSAAVVEGLRNAEPAMAAVDGSRSWREAQPRSLPPLRRRRRRDDVERLLVALEDSRASDAVAAHLGETEPRHGSRAGHSEAGREEGALPTLPRLEGAPPVQTLLSPPRRHPDFRLALTVPWIGQSFPSWFPYFLSSCARSAFLADWLIFHEDATVVGQEELPPNVILFNMGKDGLGRLFGTKLAAAIGEDALAPRLVRLFQTAFREFAYIVTEYKPTHGTVFSDYLNGYSHWSYTDIDMLIGDLPLFIEREELVEYDIFTYHFGDVYRLYLRGQFAAHQNREDLNLLWTKCEHLGSGLLSELEYKYRVVRALAKQGKRGRTRFISAEGCYSHAVATTPGLRVKFASKAFADWSDDAYFYVADGAVRKCPQPAQVWHGPRQQLVSGSSSAQECEPFGPRIAPHSLLLEGVQRAIGNREPVHIHPNCSRWVDEKWRVCADLNEDEAPRYNVLLHNGKWQSQRFESRQPSKSLEGAFLHLQRWKGRYKQLKYGDEDMPILRGRRLFKLSARGLTPIDTKYDDETGIAQ